MRDFIIETYNEFLSFMNINKKLMPLINPIEADQEKHEDIIAYVNSDEIKFPVTNLYYNANLLSGTKNYVQAKLYHEFTHIVDYLHFHNKYNEKQLDSIMLTYSEYHASQIELLKNIGFSNKNKLYKIDIDKTYIAYKDSNHSVTDNYIQPLGNSSVIIDKPENYYSSLDMVEYYKYYKKFETNVMYYLGKQSICFMLSKTSISDLSSNIYGDFYNHIFAIKKCFKYKDFDKLPQARKELWHKYLSRFPNDFNDELYPII